MPQSRVRRTSMMMIWKFHSVEPLCQPLKMFLQDRHRGEKSQRSLNNWRNCMLNRKSCTRRSRITYFPKLFSNFLSKRSKVMKKISFSYSKTMVQRWESFFNTDINQDKTLNPKMKWVNSVGWVKTIQWFSWQAKVKTFFNIFSQSQFDTK